MNEKEVMDFLKKWN